MRYRRGSIALVAVLALTGAGVGAVRAGTPDSRAARWNESATPRPSAVPELPAAGKPRTATARKNPAPARKPSVTRARAVQEARVAVRRNGAAVRSAPGEGYRVVDAVVDAAGTRHVRFQRTHRGLAVLGGDFVVHSTATGRFAGATVAQQHVIDVPGVAKVGRARAVAAAERFAGRRGAGRVRQVVDAFAGEPVRAWEVTVGAQVVIVDATTGAVRRAYDEVHTAEAGTGHGQLVGDVPLGTTRRADGTYALVDPDRGGNTVRDALNNGYLFKPDKFAEFGDADDVWGDGTRADRATAAVDVHYGMARTWDYLRSAFGRSGLHDDGRGVAAYVHHDVDEANASWSSSCECMFFGDGAPTGQPFTSLDVVAHELAHGLNSATADLVNAGESGALNEADSDIFGTLVEFSAHNAADPPDYLIGEKTEIRTPALRRMDEPSRDGKSVSCWSPAAKDLDEHYASGIGNKFFYTLAVGSGASQWGDSPPCGGAPPVAGIGNDRAAQIWYRALTVYMVSNTNYAGARDATGRAAADLYGPDSVERRTVDAAWLAVGVDGSDPAYGAPDLAYFADSSPSPRVGEAVRIQVSAREPQGQPVTFSAVNLPPGVSIDAAGLITGTPTVRGDYRSDIIASDPDGNTDRELMWWTVKGPPVVQSVPPAVTMQLGAGAYGSFTTTFADTPDDRADPADSFEVTATGVPEGLTLTVRRPGSGIYNALVSGVPTTAGSGTTVLTATDADGDRVTASVPWQVLPARRPGLPLGVSVTGGNGTALLQWAKPSYTFGDVLVTGYVVRVSPGVETTLAASARSLTLTGLDTRRAYTVGLRATSAIGDGAEKTVTLSPTALPLTVTPAAFGYGKSATLTGQVLRGRAAIAGTTATLEQRAAGRTAWSRITTVRTDAKGAWRATVKPSGTTAYRIRYAGSSGAWAATSATPSATVRYTVTIKASTTRPKAGKKIRITGTAKPGRAGVKITLQRKVGSRWLTVTSTKTAASGAYSFSRSFGRGAWTLRVSVAGGTTNAGVTSSRVKLTVK
ncbi:M4 family metallopeptidase [Actinoplanes nipponensis]|uniref:M4 family metallopeptidase n=1 Tax=Actinoplanes nipponensis TaxID=135950 RepID=UPI0019451085|nr:M4 family metallopeptidase [Actinoplanes nipponensis]